MEPLMNRINSYERATQQPIPVATQNKGNGRSNKLLALSMSVVVVEFYDDILIEILCRLPCKSAIRMKCVCNRWLRLISSGTFIGQFVKHHTSIGTKEAWSFMYSSRPPRLPPGEVKLCYTSKKPVFKSRGFSLSFLPCYQVDNFVHICPLATFNDLILCCDTKSKFRQVVYYICNPLTMQWVALPPTPRCHKLIRIGFICEPFIDQDFGCGRNAEERRVVVSFEYKFRIVRITGENDDRARLVKLEIYSSETGIWTDHVVSLPKGFCPGFQCYRSALAWKGMLIFHTTTQLMFLYPFKVTGSVSNATSQCLFFNAPDCFREWHDYLRLSVSEGQLFLHRSSSSIFLFPKLDIWLLDHDGQRNATKWSWRLIHKIDYCQIVVSNKWVSKYMEALILGFPLTHKVKFMSEIGLAPHDHRRFYLCLSPDARLAVYKPKKRSLKLVSKSDLVYPVTDQLASNDFFLLKLPLWPTPVQAHSTISK